MADHFSFSKLVVGDLERSATFYQSVFGLVEQARVDATIDGRAIREIMYRPTAPGGATFVLLAFTDTAKPAAGETIPGFITQDIDALVKRAGTAGAQIVKEPTASPEHGVTVAFVRDPEGHLIEIVQVV